MAFSCPATWITSAKRSDYEALSCCEWVNLEKLGHKPSNTANSLRSEAVRPAVAAVRTT